jgi:hypothetical protein
VHRGSGVSLVKSTFALRRDAGATRRGNIMNHCNFRFFDLQNKTLLITGTTKGIGKAALPILLEQGLNLISVSNDLSLMEEIRAELGVAENRLRLYQCDLADAVEVQ